MKQTRTELAADAAWLDAVISNDRTSTMMRCAECHASTFHWLHDDGHWICRFVGNHDPLPEVGMGASLRYVTDTRAMVITKVTAKTVVASYVEVEDDVITETACDEGAYGLRPTRQNGRLDAIIPGTETRFTLNKHGDYVHNGQRLSIGRSYSRTDWRL